MLAHFALHSLQTLFQVSSLNYEYLFYDDLYHLKGELLQLFVFLEFVAGEMVHTLIGFTNKGESDFVVTGIEASFR